MNLNISNNHIFELRIKIEKYELTIAVQIYDYFIYSYSEKIVLQKALLHEAIFPATCDATDDDSIARQVAE